jgi:hypothetical protein
VYTEIWLTAAANQTLTFQAAPPTETETQVPQASPTLGPSNTPLVSETPQGGPTEAITQPSSTPISINTVPPLQQPCDNAEFVEDVTYPDGAEVSPGIVITKTWRFKNLGPCDWDKDYHLIYGWQTEGAGWENTQPVPFNKIVHPGETLDISVKLKVPAAEGGYGAWFRLQNDKGFNFGDVFAVYIKVVKP